MTIEFSKEEKDFLAKKLQAYFREKLEMELGQFDAFFLLDFVAQEFGAHFYNRGLYDAQATLEKRMDEVKESILELEKMTQSR